MYIYFLLKIFFNGSMVDKRVILLPRGYLAVSINIFFTVPTGCVGQGCYWRLVCGGQGCCSVPSNAQDSAHSKYFSGPNSP